MANKNKTRSGFSMPELGELGVLLQQLVDTKHPLLVVHKIEDQVYSGLALVEEIPAAVYYEMLAGLVSHVATGLEVDEKTVIDAVDRFVQMRKLAERQSRRTSD